MGIVKKIHKRIITIRNNGIQMIGLPVGARIVHWEVEVDKMSCARGHVWYEFVDTGNTEWYDMYLQVIGTGQAYANSWQQQYTWRDGIFVWHIISSTMGPPK